MARQGPDQHWPHGNVAQAIVACKTGARAKSDFRNRPHLARGHVSASWEIQPPQSGISIGPSRSNRIAMTRSRTGSSIWIFFPRPDFADTAGGAQILVGRGRLQIRKAQACARSLDPQKAHRRRICLFRFQNSFGGICLPAGAAIPRQGELPDQLLLRFAGAGFDDRGFPLAGRCLDRRLSSLSDDELADRIQADGVDILVDLSGHYSGSRLNVFARKPAPVQVTAWGHATGTGIQTMDYLFSDPVIIPRECPASICGARVRSAVGDHDRAHHRRATVPAANAAQRLRHLRRVQPDRQDIRPGDLRSGRNCCAR